MKNLRRNLQPFYFCTVTEATEDETDGYYTGALAVEYNEPILARGVISANQGEAQVEQFGNNLQYSRVISTTDTSLPIDETTVLFVDTEPTYNDEDIPEYNYIVKAVARSINVVAYAIDKVVVS